MNAVLSIELEISEPALVASARDMRSLHPGQVRWVSIRLAADGADAVTFSSTASLHDLTELAQRSQPDGTAVLVWYQGRSEGFVI